MPRVIVETSHALGRQEAVRRLKEKFSAVSATHQDKVGDLHKEWNENTLSFGFRAAGMKIAGTVTVEDSEVKLAAKLPLAAIMFKGMIEERIREELGDLLA